MTSTRRARRSRTRLVGIVALVLGSLLSGGISLGWWWTDLQARQNAHHLADDAVRSWTSTSGDSWTTTSGDERRTAAAASTPPSGVEGSVIAVVRSPRLGADWRMPIQRGTGPQVLREGLGLYTGSPAPGARGNVAVAGHRTTWGAPLKHLDRLRDGDLITLWTARHRFDYRVISAGVTVPSDISVIQPMVAGGEAMLTLTTCHPEFSARERLYVHAVLIDSAKTG